MLWALLVVALQGAAADCHAAPTPYDCAVAQVEHQEYLAAIGTLKQILAQTPADLKALNLLGIALTNAGKPGDAEAYFQQALAIDPNFVPARKNLAINQFARAKLSAAYQNFQEVLARAPDDDVAHLHVGELLVMRGQRRAALPHYEKAETRVLRARNATWLLHYAACVLDGDSRDAGKPVARAVALFDQLPEGDGASAFEAGVLLGRAKAYREAARFFAAARNGYRDRYAAGYNQVLMLVNAGDVASATEAIRAGDELFAQGAEMKTAELYSLVAQAYLKTERIKEAYDALREATRLEPKAVEHYVDLAMICVDHQNFDLGLEIVAIGLKYRPESSLLYLQQGVLFAMKGSIEQAAAAFAHASKVAPNEAVPYVAQSMIWMQTGQASKAVDVLRAQAQARTQPRVQSKSQPQPKSQGLSQANAQTPTPMPAAKQTGAAATAEQDALIFYALGVALLRAGASPEDAAGTEAMHAFASAVRLSPEFPQARAELGKLLMKRGDTDGAVTHLEKAVALDPENAAPAYVLAQAYRKRGEMDRARDLLARVSTINTRERGDDPDHELKRVIIRIVREGATPKGNGTEP